MMTNLQFHFSGVKGGKEIGTISFPIEEEKRAAEKGDNIMQKSQEITSNGSSSDNNRYCYFNDIEFYQSLLKKKGCCRVDIVSLLIRHNACCHGIQAIYRLNFTDGAKPSEKYHGPMNFYHHGNYTIYRGAPRDTWIHLKEEEEFITGIRINQDETTLHGITFVTNRREIPCGIGVNSTSTSNFDNKIPKLHERSTTMRIVAFSGSVDKYGVWKRVGYYRRSFGWELIGHYILLRHLVNQGRATISLKKELKPSSDGKNRKVLMDGLMKSLNDDVFRTVMEFLR